MTALDLTAFFRRAIDLNAQAWAAVARQSQAGWRTLDAEQANLSKAVWQALQEPLAWDSGLALLAALWPYIEFSGQWLQWQALFERALEVSRRAGKRGYEAQVLLYLGELARIVGDFAVALARQQAALDVWRELGDTAGMGRGLASSSQVHLAVGDSAAAEQACVAGIALLQGPDAAADLAVATNNLGIIRQEQGRSDEAMALYGEAARLFEMTGNLRGQAKVANNQGWVLQSQGHPDQAADLYRQAIGLYRRVGDDVHLARTQVNLGIALYLTGHVAEALALHREVETIFRRLGDRPWTARVVNNEGVFFHSQGSLVEAESAFDQAARLYRELGDAPSEAHSRANLAEVLMDAGKLAEARTVLRQIDSLLNTLANPPEWVLSAYQAQVARWDALAGEAGQGVEVG